MYMITLTLKELTFTKDKIMQNSDKNVKRYMFKPAL